VLLKLNFNNENGSLGISSKLSIVLLKSFILFEELLTILSSKLSIVLLKFASPEFSDMVANRSKLSIVLLK